MYHLSEPTIAEGTGAALQRVMASNYFSPGPEVEAFEEEWAAYCGVKYGVACNSGTTAIEMAMVALHPKGRVLIPAFTCIPTAVPFVHAGYEIQLVDCGPDGNVTVQTLKDAYRGEVLFVPVHIYGNPVKQDVIMAAESLGLTVMEDCAEAHGAGVKERLVGSYGEIGCFSFRGDKMITSGGVGGMGVTDSKELADYMRRYSLLFLTGPSETRYDADGIGNGIQMGELQAAFGRCQIPTLERLISVRRQLAKVYDTELREFDSYLEPAPRAPGSVVWRYMITIYNAHSRPVFISRLIEKGVQAMASFRSLSTVLPPLTGKHYTSCPVAESLGNHGVCLPIHANLTEADIKKICSIIGGVLREL